MHAEGEGAEYLPPSSADILLFEVTPQMALEGALVLREWAQGSPDYQGLSLRALAGIVYSRMRLVAPTPSAGARFQVEDEADRKTARQLKRQIRRAK